MSILVMMNISIFAKNSEKLRTYCEFQRITNSKQGEKKMAKPIIYLIEEQGVRPLLEIELIEEFQSLIKRDYRITSYTSKGEKKYFLKRKNKNESEYERVFHFTKKDEAESVMSGLKSQEIINNWDYGSLPEFEFGEKSALQSWLIAYGHELPTVTTIVKTNMRHSK